MKKNTIRYCISALLLLGLIFALGCILDPKEEPAPNPIQVIQVGDRTKVEHCIGNLVIAYSDRDIDLIEELFHADYIFVYQPDDVPAGEDPFIGRADDIRVTNNMFLAADGQYDPAIEELSLKIDPGAWVAVTEVAGQPCDDCWETERNYTLRVVIGETTYLGNDIVKFIVIGGDEEGVTKYKIRIIYDIPEN